MKNTISKLPLEEKHILMSKYFGNVKGFGKYEKAHLKYLHKKRMSVYNESIDKHGYTGANMLAIESVLKIVYSEN